MKSIVTGALVSLLGVSAARGQTVHSFVTTIGTDTLCLEQYTLSGNLVSGTWVVLHPPGVFAHVYRLTLGPDGVPVRYTMKYSTPGAPAKPDLDSVIVAYGRDTALYTMVFRDSTVTHHVPMHEAFPALGQSWVGLEPGLARLRRLGVDSGIIVMNAPTQAAVAATRWPIRFLGGDSAIIVNNGALVSADGSLLGMTAGPVTVRRVPSLDMPALVASFVSAFAPRAAALAAAAASRVEVAVPAAQLDKLAGEYSINAANSITITRQGEHLVLSAAGGSRFELAAQSQTEFFLRKPDLVLIFDVDAHGIATAVTLVQGEGKQRLEKVTK
jgi:hypothetical protein